MQEEEVIYEDLQLSESTNDATVEEVVQVIEVTEVEAFEVEMDEAFPALGEIDALNHALLSNRELHDAHPITAITGLREELDSIEALKTVYSDKKGNADYYEWADGHALGENGVGYFVSLNKDVRTISICSGDDIFGVVVDSPAFVGGQDKVARDAHYGLVATTGAVHVRCELNVAEGDYVISNAKGVATKASSGRGYKVVALHDIQGVPHATINLNISADQIDLMGAELKDLDSRMDAAETNIVSAVNVANEAYKKASEIDISNLEISNKVDNALGVVDRLEGDVTNMGEQVANSAVISAQAKAIAESAATSAASMKEEAVEKANEALAENSELRKEFEAKVVEIDTELDNTALELQATKEEFDTTINDLKLDTEGQLADFKKEVEDNYATTAQLAAVKTENSDAVAALKQEVSDTYATIESVTSLKTETSDALAGFKQEVSKTYATQEMLTSLETETSKALADYKQEATNTYATQEMVTKLETDTSKALADYKQEVEEDYATQEMVAQLETDTSKALSDYKQEVGKTYATNTSLANLRTDTTNAIAASEEKASETYASKSDLTSFEGNINIAMARIEQKADANGAYIQSTVSNMDKYAVGPYSQAYGFTLEQAASVLEEGMIYVPTETKTGEKAETYNYTDTDGSTKTYTREFVKHYLYKWGKIGDRYGWITVDKNYTETTETNTSAQAVYFTTTVPAVSGNFGYWYTDGDTVTEGYESYTLYKWESYVDEGGATQYHWVAVATLAGNAQNRAVSQIRQDTNSIVAEVTNARGDAASLGLRITETESEVQSLAAWTKDADGNQYNLATIKQTANDAGASIAQVVEAVGEDGKVNAASIVTAVNNDTSGVTITADHINLQGSVTISDLDTNTANKLNNAIASTVIEYALSDSPTTAPTSAWNTTAPDWRDDKYMWQKTTITYNDANKEPTVTMTCIQGAKGKQGEAGADGQTPTIEINDDGYWVIDGAATTIKAQGTDGTTPTISIDSNGYWVINGATTTVKAQGDNGVSVTGVVEQYCISTSQSTQPTTGWNQSFDTILTTYNTNRKDNPNTTYYIWSRNAVTYSNGAKTYSNATVQGASSFVASWCNVNDKTKIDGGNIATGTIKAVQIDAGAITADKLSADALKSNNYDVGTAVDEDHPLVPSTGYSAAGTFFDLSNGAIYAPHFHLDADGKINAVGGGVIGGFTIGQSALYSNSKTSYNSVGTGVHLGSSGIGVGSNFSVKASNGYLTANSGQIGTWNIDSTGISSYGVALLAKNSNDACLKKSLVMDDDSTSAVRIYAGGSSSKPNEAKFMVLDDGSVYAEAADITGTVRAKDGEIGGWQLNGDSLTNYGGTKDAAGYYPNSFCMQTKTETNGAVNAMAIGKCSEATWGQAAFRVTVDGEMYATGGAIGSCTFQSIRYPVIGQDLQDPTGVGLRAVYEGTNLHQTRYLDYKVRYSPSDDYSTKTFTPYSFNNYLSIYSGDICYWYYAWTDSPDAPPSAWTDNYYFSDMDTSIIETYPHFWLKCFVTRRTGYESEQDIDNIVYYIGDFSEYLTVFNLGDGALNIGENIIAGKASSIKFEDNKGRLSGTWYYDTAEIAVKSWRDAKSNIEELDDRYSTLFDELRPVRFTYNDGTSNRYHTGIILDELKDAMDKANVDTSEFAAYCVSDETTGEGGIRYSELIALCVEQIQKLKKKTIEQDNRIAELEAQQTD